MIRAGEGVTVSLAAANRDPRRFAEPDRFHIHGDARGHVAFGYGRHVCLGQHLARLELEVGLTGLMRGGFLAYGSRSRLRRYRFTAASSSCMEYTGCRSPGNGENVGSPPRP